MAAGPSGRVAAPECTLEGRFEAFVVVCLSRSEGLIVRGGGGGGGGWCLGCCSTLLFASCDLESVDEVLEVTGSFGITRVVTM
jgi:hypothetical protein